MYDINQLPKSQELETMPVLKKTATAHRALAEFKGICQSIPNQSILISTLALQEAKDASEVENIITTHDELFGANISPETITVAAKEVKHYLEALLAGFKAVKENNFLTLNHILQIQEILERNKAGFRKQLGTSLKNERTGEIVYTPPQHYDEIINLMGRLEKFINNSEDDFDPLVKMAVIHHQFESIHPFYDGNGRTGRIINVLFLVLSDLLDIPALYLSRYIVRNKDQYYQLLQEVRDTGNWENWIIYMLNAIETTAKKSTKTVNLIKQSMMKYKHIIREEFNKIYSQDLINHLFNYPYTKIEFIEKELKITRPTATKYLEQLTEKGLLKKIKRGKNNYYINVELFDILLNV
ncbi:MAG: Fic family protein [Cardiobacteriaceae bacterium]|nr:Fic family protein [Cardiobacteriaceae bacterium]